MSAIESIADSRRWMNDKGLELIACHMHEVGDNGYRPLWQMTQSRNLTFCAELASGFGHAATHDNWPVEATLAAHLWDPLWTDEASCLDGVHACSAEARDELGLECGRYDGRFILEPVSRADLDDVDIVGVGRGSICARGYGAAAQARAEDACSSAMRKHGEQCEAIAAEDGEAAASVHVTMRRLCAPSVRRAVRAMSTRAQPQLPPPQECLACRVIGTTAPR